MRFPGKHIPILAAGLLLAGCAEEGVKQESPSPPRGVGPAITPDAGGGAAIMPGGNQPAIPINVTPREEISWTNPDDPDAGIPELENLMAAPKKGPWEESETIARQTAVREGKPILVWFTDSARSPMCKVLSAELFGKPEFAKWAEEHVVRLKVDSNVTVDDFNMSLDDKLARQSRIKDYVKSMKKRYRILGHPSVLMLNPSGEVITRYRGFKRGEGEFFWGLIKQGAASSEAAHSEWRKGLEKKGYREWNGKAGRKVFAKLAQYSKGKLVLIEPGGERYKTDETSLSKDDRRWIEDQKEMRGIE